MPLGESPSLFDAHLLIPFEDESPIARFRQLLDNSDEIGDFLCRSLLYERIIIPSVNLMVIPLLACWIGPTSLVEAFKQKDIQIIRYRGALGYVGNGGGLEMFEIRSNREEKIEKEFDLNWAPPDEVIRTLGRSLDLAAHSNFGSEWLEVEHAALENLIEFESKEFDKIAEATYREIMDNPWLQSYFAIRNTNLKYLQGIDANQVRWVLARHMNDEIDLLLHMAQFNFECYLAGKAGATDQTGGPAAQHILQSRVERIIGSREKARGFTQILDLNRIPNFAAIADDDEAVNHIWSLRQTKEAKEFRRWFHEKVGDNPGEAQAAFVETLARPVLKDKLLVKSLRYIVLNLIPSLVPLPVVSALTGALDTFLLDRFLKPRGPKVMIDQLRKAFKARQA